MPIRFLFAILFLCAAALANAQSLPCSELVREEDSLSLDDLRQRCGRNKHIPPRLEIQALKALSAYPDLAEASITFKFRKQKTAHSARPTLFSVFRKPNHRKYIVFVSTKVPDFFLPGQHFNLPYTAQVGVLGHELGHIQQYHRGKGLSLVGMGLKYAFSKKFVIEVEHKTDSTAIAQGLGCELWAWSKIARPLLVQAGRGQNYLKPEEIQEILEEKR
jgi:hypothetical protein